MTKNNHCSIEEIAVKIVEDETGAFPLVTEFLVDVWLVNPARNGLAKNVR
jgi:hypothetical protein